MASSSRNPSWNLSNDALDDIIDRLLLGKYEKHYPVTFKEAVSIGLHAGSGGSVEQYVIARYGTRGRYASSLKGGPLSKAGVTMRSNKITERIAKIVVSIDTNTEPSLVWSIRNNRTYSTICYATGTRTGAIGWAFTLFGWTQGPEIKMTDLSAFLLGAGGSSEAAARNLTMVGTLQRQRDGIITNVESLQKKLEDMNLLIDTVMSTAAMATG